MHSRLQNQLFFIFIFPWQNILGTFFFFLLLLCPSFQRGSLFLFRMSGSCWTGSPPACFGGLGLVLMLCYCFGLFNFGCGLSWLMTTGPQVAVPLFDTMACLFGTERLFSRCRSGKKTDCRRNSRHLVTKAVCFSLLLSALFIAFLFILCSRF